MTQTTLAFGRMQMDQGIERSAAKAEREYPGWKNAAAQYLRYYIERHRIFCGWMVVQSTLGVRDFPQPGNTKAWGAVLNRAARDGLIRKVGVVPDPNRHCAYVPQWESLIFQEAMR
jgi:hypothetical protein